MIGIPVKKRVISNEEYIQIIKSGLGNKLIGNVYITECYND